MSINESAREIVLKAIKRERSRRVVADLYGIPPTLVEEYLCGGDCGALTARKVIRVEISRLNAAREGKAFKPTDKDRYKGTRQY